MSDQALEQSPEERMMALLGDEPDEVQEAEAVQQEEEVTEEPEAEAQPEPRKLKLKWDGQEVEKDEDEVISLAQQGYDYTQKTQRLADERRAIEEKAQAIKAQESAFQEQVALQQAMVKEIAKVVSIDEQLANFNGVDWNQLTDADPVQAQKLLAQFTQLNNQKQRLVQELNQRQQQIAHQHQAQREEMLRRGEEQLQRDIPGWNDKMVSEIRETVKAYGFTDQEISQVTDPRLVRMMHEATQYRKLQQAKPQIENKVAGKAPVVKPGSKDANAANKAEIRQIREKLTKRGRLEDAAALIEKTL